MSSNSSSNSTPLPLAPNRAAVANRISMLLASQSSVLKSMSLSAPTRTRKPVSAVADDNDFLKGTRPNEGVGYVAEKTPVPVGANDRADRLLRRGLKTEGRGARTLVESESEDEVGRSALGRRKRKRREPEDVPQEASDADEARDVVMETDAQARKEDATDEIKDTDDNDGEKKKRKRKKKKTKSKKKQLQEPAAEAST